MFHKRPISKSLRYGWKLFSCQNVTKNGQTMSSKLAYFLLRLWCFLYCFRFMNITLSLPFLRIFVCVLGYAFFLQPRCFRFFLFFSFLFQFVLGICNAFIISQQSNNETFSKNCFFFLHSCIFSMSFVLFKGCEVMILDVFSWILQIVESVEGAIKWGGAR